MKNFTSGLSLKHFFRTKKNSKLGTWIKKVNLFFAKIGYVEKLGVIFLLLGLAIGYIGFDLEYNNLGCVYCKLCIDSKKYCDIYQFIIQNYFSIALELISIAITILIIDRTYELRSKKELLERLKRQLGSKHSVIALEAVDQLRSIDALTNGSLQYIKLRHADLSSADLEESSLEGADMESANLSNANLTGVKLILSILTNTNFSNAKVVSADLSNSNLYNSDLSGADLSWTNLEGCEMLTENQLGQCRSLWGCILPNGERYDGRFDLPGDIEEAKRYGINYDDPTERTRFYSIDFHQK